MSRARQSLAYSDLGLERPHALQGRSELDADQAGLL
jgi:hypothetical protein